MTGLLLVAGDVKYYSNATMMEGMYLSRVPLEEGPAFCFIETTVRMLGRLFFDGKFLVFVLKDQLPQGTKS